MKERDSMCVGPLYSRQALQPQHQPHERRNRYNVGFYWLAALTGGDKGCSATHNFDDKQSNNIANLIKITNQTKQLLQKKNIHFRRNTNIFGKPSAEGKWFQTNFFYCFFHYALVNVHSVGFSFICTSTSTHPVIK